jgi:hypothetical protein
MPVDIKISFNTKNLDELKKNLTQNDVVEIGIFGNKAPRPDATTNLTNVEIGIKHEFGSIREKIPKRSFLEMPILYKKDELVKASAKIIGKNIMAGKPKEFSLKQIGIIAEAIIQKAFDTGGYGMWLPLSQVTIDRKGKSNILEDKLLLRKSITSRVRKVNT